MIRLRNMKNTDPQTERDLFMLLFFYEKMLWCNAPNPKFFSFSRNFKKFGTRNHCIIEAAISSHQ